MQIQRFPEKEGTIRDLFSATQDGAVAKVNIMRGLETSRTYAFITGPNIRRSQSIPCIQAHARETLELTLTFLATARIHSVVTPSGERRLVLEKGNSGYCRAVHGFDWPSEPHEAQALLVHFRDCLNATLNDLGIEERIDETQAPQLLLTHEPMEVEQLA